MSNDGKAVQPLDFGPAGKKARPLRGALSHQAKMKSEALKLEAYMPRTVIWVSPTEITAPWTPSVMCTAVSN